MLTNIFEKHIQWPAVKEVWQRLHENGHQVYLAGGCVRDVLLGRKPKDFDIATDAAPEEVEALFEKSLPIGKAFGVVMLPFEGFQIEVARFRQDGPYKDGRRPESVSFYCSPKEDALRRDFTVNALFYDLEKNEVIDYVDGIKDLKSKILRTVGDPIKRYEEDKLRMLRAVEFLGQLDFELESKTFNAIRGLHNKIDAVSKERVFAELTKIMESPNRVKALQTLFSSQLGPVLFADLPIADSAEKHENFYWSQTKLALILLEKEKRQSLLWSAFLVFQLKHWQSTGLKSWSEGVNLALIMIESFKPPAAIVKSIKFILLNLPEIKKQADKDIAEALLILDQEHGPEVLDLWALIDRVEGKESTVREELLEHFNSLANKDGHLPECYLNGNDLIELGFEPGAKIGETLKSLYKKQLTGEINSKEAAINWITN